jgi:hypothetical protein
MILDTGQYVPQLVGKWWNQKKEKKNKGKLQNGQISTNQIKIYGKYNPWE